MNDSIFFELEEEKKKILKMVEEKKITAEEAQDQNKEKGKENHNFEDESCKKKIKIPNVRGKIVVHVFENGVKKVNIQLPIGLVKIAEKFPIQTNSDIPIQAIIKTAKENGLNIEQGMYVLIEDEEVHIYDADGVEFVSVKKFKD